MEEPLRGRLEGKNIDAVAARLIAGGVAVLPTDTIYGFHCVYSNAGSIDRIMKLKGRPKSTGFILLASSIEMADTLVSRWPKGSRETLASLWPAPLTAILPASRKIPSSLGPGGGVAVRIPAMPVLLRLIEKAGEPLVSTSVNRSGRPPLNRIDGIEKAFEGLDAYIRRTGPGRRNPSTIVDLTQEKPILVRRGGLESDALKAFGLGYGKDDA